MIFAGESRLQIRTVDGLADCAIGFSSSPHRHGIASISRRAIECSCRFRGAGTAAEQRIWIDECARAYAAAALVDFGFIGTKRRFEAKPLTRRPVRAPLGRGVGLLDDGSSSRSRHHRACCLSKNFQTRAISRLRGFLPIHLSVAARTSKCSPMLGPLIAGVRSRSSSVGNYRARLALALLRLVAHKPREVCAVSSAA